MESEKVSFEMNKTVSKVKQVEKKSATETEQGQLDCCCRRYGWRHSIFMSTPIPGVALLFLTCSKPVGKPFGGPHSERGLAARGVTAFSAVALDNPINDFQRHPSLTPLRTVQVEGEGASNSEQ